MKRILSAAIVFLAASLSAQVQIGRNVQIGGASGGGTGTVTSVSTAGYPSPFGTVVITFSTTTPLITFTAPTYSQNQFLAGPTSGSGNPTARAIVPGDVPTLNQNTTGTASNLSGTPALPNGTTATTQSPGDNTTKLATDAFVLANAGSGAVSSVSNSDSSLTVTPTTGAVVASINPAHANTWTAPQTFAGSGPPISIPANKATSPSAGTGQFGTDASGNLVSSDNNAAQARVCNATNGACSIFSVLNYGGNAGGTMDNSAAVTAACSANGQVFFPVGTYNFTSNYVIPCPESFQVGAALKAPNSVTVTVNPQIQAFNYQQIFVTAGTGAFIGLSGAVPVEYFGAIGYSTRALAIAGSLSGTAIQAALTSVALRGGWAELHPLYYKVTTGDLVIIDGQTGIVGSLVGRDSYNGGLVGGTAHSSVIGTLSTSGTIVDVEGADSAHPVVSNIFKHFAIERWAQCTSMTSTDCIGMKLENAIGTQVESVSSNDNLDHLWGNNAPSIGTGHFDDFTGNNGLFPALVNSYASGQSIHLVNIDSENGLAPNTMLFHNPGLYIAPSSTAACTTGVDSTTIFSHGTAVNDIDVYQAGSAGDTCTLIDDGYDGSGAPDSEADQWFYNPIGEAHTVMKYHGFSFTGGSPSVNIVNGYTLVNHTGGTGIDCEGSIGLNVIGLNMLTIGSGGGPATGVTGFYANGCSHFKFQNTMGSGFQDGFFVNVLGGSSAYTITGNNIAGIDPAHPVTNAFIFATDSLVGDESGNTCGGFVTTCDPVNHPAGTSASFFGDLYSNGTLLTGGSSYPQITSANNGTTGNNFTALKFMSGSGTVPCYAGQLAGQQWLDGCNGTYAGGSAPIYTVASSAQLHRLYPCAISATVSSCEETQLAPLGTIAANIPTTSVSFWGQYDPISGNHQTWIDPQAESPTFPANISLAVNPSANWFVKFDGSTTTTNVIDSALTTNPTCAVSGLLADCSTTGTGSSVRATSPTLVTPALGTPSAVVLTNGTGLPAASVLSGALANGMTATTQTVGDNTTKLATDAFVLANTVVYPGAGIPKSTGSAWGTSYTATGTGASVATASGGLNNGHLVSWITAGGGVDATDSGLIAPIVNAITTATGGSGTGTVTCATATCTNQRGSYTVGGGTFATGTILTLVWPTTTNSYVCWATVLNNATGASIGYHSIATATGMNITSLTAATGLSVDIDYGCTP